MVYAVGGVWPAGMVVGGAILMVSAFTGPVPDTWLALPAFVILVTIGVCFLLDLGSEMPPAQPR